MLRSLEVARSGRLTIVVAPPGYGKTTALAQWYHILRDTGVKVAWYGASEREREPGEFLRMLALALEAGGIDPGDAARRAIADGNSATALDAIVLGIERAQPPAVIILDDFERIDHGPIVALLSDLIEALPEGIHVTIAARRKPTLAISLLRAQGSVRTIDPSELRLDRGELALTLGLASDAPELDLIASQTEGWPVAAQLYRLWRERVASGHGVMPGFGAQASEVAEYLAEQVFGALPDDHQAILADLSILDHADATLGDHIRGRRDSQALLSDIAARLPSLVQHSVADGDIAYRLHPLLSDYARSRLALIPGRAASLHQRAADWYWSRHHHAIAIRHAVLSKDEAPLVILLDALPYLDIFLTFGVAELRVILREIPSALAAARPRIRLMNTLIHFKSGFFIEAEQMRAAIAQDCVDPLATDPDSVRLQRESIALQLLYTIYIDGPAVDSAALHDRLRALSPGMPLMWSWSENTRLVELQEAGDLARASQALAKGRESYRLSGEVEFAELNLLTHDLLLDLAYGRLRTAHERAAVIQRRPATRRFGEQWQHAMARIATAAVDYDRSYRAQSAEVMRIALVDFGTGEAWFDQYAIAFPVMIDVTFRRHGVDEALREAARLGDEVDRRGLRCLAGLMRWITLTLYARAGDLTRAATMEQHARHVLAPSTTRIAWRERDLAARGLAALALARGDAAEVMRIAAAMVSDGVEGARLGTQVKGLVQLALGQDLAGATGDADATLHEAIRIAYPEGFVAAFAEEGRAIIPLLRRTLRGDAQTLPERHVQAILRTIDGERQFAAANSLTDREAEILAHLADGASNKLIGRRLGLSDNTIKFHLKKIYAKLGVGSRKAAVAHAQAPGS